MAAMHHIRPISFVTLAYLCVFPAPLLAAETIYQAAAPASETGFIFNTILFLVFGMIALLIIPGFTIIEAGYIKKKNAGTSLLKNILLYSVTGIMFYLVGYKLMYDSVAGGFLGSVAIWAPDDSSIIDSKNFSYPFAAASDWFFQMILASMTAFIVSGTLGVRVKMWPFLIFIGLLTGVIYPITGSWLWGNGWLAELGFMDFAGATFIHSVGGWCALTGTLILGPRTGRFKNENTLHPQSSNIICIGAGTLLVWIGWLGYSGGSQLSLGTAADAADISNILVNTNLAAMGGILTATIAHKLLFKTGNSPIIVWGAIGGLVSISAEPLVPPPYVALLIGSMGGLIVVLTAALLRRLKIDDVIGALPAHLACGIWGTLAVPISNHDAIFHVQLTGIFTVAGFTLITSFIIWSILRYSLGIRVKNEKELHQYSLEI